jgi:putative nucleotidyltransferase with HDIG domain
MTLLAAEPSPIFSEFAQRALELGALCWCCDGDGEIISQTQGNNLAAALARSDRFRAALRSAARGAENAVTECLAGCRFLKYGDGPQSLVAMILTPGAAGPGPLIQICGEAGFLPEKSLAPLVQSDDGQANRIAAVLGHYHHDLAGAAAGRRLSDQFTDQLSQSYEVLNVLFRMAHCLNSRSDPAEVTQKVCDELAQVLPFGWVAIWFGEGERVVPDLAGRLTASGTLPCRREQFIEHARRVCCCSVSEAWSPILLRGQSELATLSGADVLSEVISRGPDRVGVLLAGNKQGDDQDVSSEETQLLGAAANFISVFHENTARYAEQRGQYLGTLHSLSAAIDAKDPYTCGHSDRVSRLTSKIASALNLDREDVEQYRIAGLLHDVGKIGVPESALCKQGRLTDEEFTQIKRHPEIGYRILHDIPSMEQVLPGVLHHHERWEGNGYPGRLAGEKIPLIGRCIALADTFDAMSSNRSYRNAMQRETVLAEIKRTAGSQFDPKLVDVFLSMDLGDCPAS